MNKYLLLIATVLLLCGNAACKGPKTDKAALAGKDAVSSANNIVIPKAEKNEDFTAFVPKDYILFDKVYGDLDKDGVDDCVLIIKGTDKSKIVKDESRGELDRNRRGLIVLLNKNGHYETVVKNYDCFSSENEDGGVYYAPELSVEIEKGNLYVRYAHGRYGFWGYTFRLQKADFELIGFDASEDRGPVVNTVTSINYLTRKKIVKQNTNENAEGEDEVFKTTESKIDVSKLIKLSEVKDFDELDVPGR